MRMWQLFLFCVVLVGWIPEARCEGTHVPDGARAVDTSGFTKTELDFLRELLTLDPSVVKQEFAAKLIEATDKAVKEKDEAAIAKLIIELVTLIPQGFRFVAKGKVQSEIGKQIGVSSPYAERLKRFFWFF